jgi:uncharacterized Zn-finger protein
MSEHAHDCRHHKGGSVCEAVRVLEERVRKLEDQAHTAFYQKLKAAPRRRTVNKRAASSTPTVKRNSKKPICPGCSAPLDHAQLAAMTSAICPTCNTYFTIS